MPDHVLDLLRGTDPVGDLDPAVRAALRELGSTVTATPAVEPVPRRARRRGGRRLVAAIAACLALGTLATVTVAQNWTARTGRQAPGGENGTGEYIDLGAPDLAEVVDEVGADIPLPPGGTFDDYVASLAGASVLTAEEGLRSTLEWRAACQWASYWLGAVDDEDAAAREAALVGLAAVPDRIGGPTDPDGTTEAMWRSLLAAAEEGDVPAVRGGGYDANCEGTPGYRSPR